MVFEDLQRFLLGAFGLVLLSGWVLVGEVWGATLLIFMSLVSLFVAWSSQHFSLVGGLFLFSGLGLIAHSMQVFLRAQGRREAVRLEEIEKDKNILADGIRSHRGMSDSLKKKIQRFSDLKELTARLSSSLLTEEVAHLIAEQTYQVVGKSDASLLYLVDVERQELSLAASRQKEGTPKIMSKKGDIFDSWVLKQRQPLLIQDATKDFRFDLAVSKSDLREFKSLVCAPLVSQESALGVLRLDNVHPQIYTQDDLRLLDIVASLSAVAMENTLLYRRTEELALKDGLTGAYVHRYFRERLAQEVSRSLRSESPLSCLMLDIDHFKSYNDRYGHSAGDLVLKKVASILNQSISDAGDIVARYGGEEFGMILIGQDKQQAIAFAEGIRKKIEAEPFILRRMETKVSVSIGVSSLPVDAKLCEDLIKKADKRLYRAKQEGRNRVCSA